jgi:hypothetical protein
MKNVSNKCFRENSNTYFMFNTIFPIIVRLRFNVEKCDGAREVTGVNIKRRLLFPCWISKVTSTPEYVPLTAFSP